MDIEELEVDIENKKVDIENVLSQKGSVLSVKTTVHIHRSSLLNQNQVTGKENINLRKYKRGIDALGVVDLRYLK